MATTTWYTSAVAWVFVDTNTPAPVSLETPLSNAIETNVDVFFEWTTSQEIGSGITNYELVITNLGTGDRTNIVLSSTNTNVILSGEGNYDWYVIATDVAGNFQESTTNSFQVDTAAPVQVTLKLPVNTPGR